MTLSGLQIRSGQRAASSEQTEPGSEGDVRNAAWPGVKCFHSIAYKPKLFQMHLQKGEVTHFPSLLKWSGEAAEVTARFI